MLKIKSKDNQFSLFDGERKIDCEITEQSNVFLGNEPALNISVKNKKDFEIILSDFGNLELRVWRVIFSTTLTKNGINLNVEVISDESYLLEFKVSFSINWSHNFSINEYVTEFARIKGNKDVYVEFKGELEQWENIEIFTSINRGENIRNLFLETENIIDNFHKRAIYVLGNDKSNPNELKISLEFPEQIKASCEQYLLYFAQFLRDLGINTTSNLKEDAGKVLFSVTPTDDFEALDKIREALAVYLNLPASPIVYDESFAAMRLQQQIENLQHSQKMAVREIRSGERELRLAQTVIEHQDKIIVQKDSLIEQQNKVIEKIQSKSIMIDSLENKAEFEKVFDGLEFGESKELKEKLGIKFNPVTSLKSLGKKLVGKDDEIISLDLN